MPEHKFTCPHCGKIETDNRGYFWDRVVYANTCGHKMYCSNCKNPYWLKIDFEIGKYSTHKNKHTKSVANQL